MKDQVELLGADLAARVGVIPSGETIFSSMNLVVTLGLWAFVPVFMALMSPRGGDSSAGGAVELHDERPEPMPPPQPHQRRSAADWLNTGPLFAWLLALPALGMIALRFRGASGPGALTFDTVNLFFFALGLLLHASPARYVAAIEDAARG
jgi:short-chain fatty acids transporter